MAANTRFLLETAGVAATTLARRLVRGPARPGWSVPTEVMARVLRHMTDASMSRGLTWLRDASAGAPQLDPVFRRVEFESLQLGGVSAERCTPRDVVASRDGSGEAVVLYLHGGGYCIGSARTSREIAARLALGAGCRSVAVDYRLSPEHLFPAAQNDCLAAYRGLLEDEGVAASSVVLAGDSAGGALCLAVLTGARDAGLPLPAGAVLISPWVDPLAEGGSMATNAPFDVGDRAFLVRFAEVHGADAARRRDPRLVVVDADLRGLSPLAVFVGTAEVLLDQNRELVARARQAGVDTELIELSDLFHAFQSVAGLVPAAARAVDEMAVRVRGFLAAAAAAAAAAATRAARERAAVAN